MEKYSNINTVAKFLINNEDKTEVESNLPPSVLINKNMTHYIKNIKQSDFETFKNRYL